MTEWLDDLTTTFTPTFSASAVNFHFLLLSKAVRDQAYQCRLHLTYELQKMPETDATNAMFYIHHYEVIEFSKLRPFRLPHQPEWCNCWNTSVTNRLTTIIGLSSVCAGTAYFYFISCLFQLLYTALRFFASLPQNSYFRFPFFQLLFLVIFVKSKKHAVFWLDLFVYTLFIRNSAGSLIQFSHVPM